MTINPTGANGGNWEQLRQRIDARANKGNGDGRVSIRELNAYKSQNKYEGFAVQNLIENYDKMKANSQPIDPRAEKNGVENGLTASEVFQHQAELNKAFIQKVNVDFIENAKFG